MTSSQKIKQVSKKSILLWILFLILMAVIGFETAIILSQQNANRQIESQSKQALEHFLKHGQVNRSIGQTAILLKNLNFCWSKNICVKTDSLSAYALPLTGETVLFDDLKSFIIDVHSADVLISPKTLEGMFNESIFNYPGSNLRNLTVGIEKVGQENHVKLTGNLKFILWIPFEMDTNLNVDQKTNTLTISVESLHIFGFLPVTGLLHIKPFNLQKLLTLPENKYLTVEQNVIMVKPFGLFPPPHIAGQMSGINVMPNMILLHFKGTPIEFVNIPVMGAKNYVYVQGGTAQFNTLKILDTHIQVIDKNPENLFTFSLLNYWHYVPLSQIEMRPDSTIILRMPDHSIGK